jgi:outer membrane cobalamin receptor
VNNYITSNKIAGYVGDEISFGEALRVDVGVRYEIRRAEWTVESSEPTGEDGEFGEALALQGFQWGNGDFTRRDVYSDDLAASVGVNYGLTDVLNLYAVGSRGYFFPELVSLTSGAEIGDLENEKFLQVEGGVKAGSPTISGTLALYYTELNDRFAADPRVDPETGVVTTVPAQIGGSQTFGVEATAAYLVPAIDGLRLDAMVTFQDHQYTDYTSGDNDFTGNWIRRQPKVMLRGAAQYEQEGFDLRVNAKYTGKRFADEANFQELDPYTVVNAGAGYTASFAEGQSLRFGVHVFNALDSRGLTEGDPRLPPGTSIEDQPFFNARPILPRRVVAKLTYNL